jgi:hypothetical protein
VRSRASRRIATIAALRATIRSRAIQDASFPVKRERRGASWAAARSSHRREAMLRRLPLRLLVALLGCSGAAYAATTEPNGLPIPQERSAAEIPWDPLRLADLFAARNEPIDWLADAGTNPSVFSPLCGFTGQLVMRGGGCKVDFGWYNVNQSSAAPPPDNEIYTLVPKEALNTLQDLHPNANDPPSQTFYANDIRTDARYQGGLVGFALRGQAETACTQTHFSEQRLNVVCTNCTPNAPWITAVIYKSKATPDAFYVAFEDLPMSPTDFGGFPGQQYRNDGDFNDFVYFITGVTCEGGGEPCDTGQPGICKNGITDCALTGGGVVCRPDNQPSNEQCDGLDNDCNGSVDDGSDLCPEKQICDRGTCVAACGGGEFNCPGALVCDRGYCVDPNCQGVACPEGEVCRSGVCVDRCDGVVCPLGHVCRVGRCVDPCGGVTCTEGQVCDQGACVNSCACRDGCGNGLACESPSGRCVDTGCEGKTCAAGEVCVAGNCANACDGAICPGGAACENGACGEPIPGAGTGGSGGTSIGTGGTGGTIPGGTGGTGAEASGGAAGSSDSKPFGKQDPSPSCSCRSAASRANSSFAALGFLLAVSAFCRRLRRRRHAPRNAGK